MDDLPSGDDLESVNDLIALLEDVREAEGGDFPVRDTPSGGYLYPTIQWGELRL